MPTKTVRLHLFTTSDPIRRHNIRCCDRCGLPETRTDIHTLPSTPADAAELEQRRMGERE